jgi:hypothetical protein
MRMTNVSDKAIPRMILVDPDRYTLHAVPISVHREKIIVGSNRDVIDLSLG